MSQRLRYCILTLAGCLLACLAQGATLKGKVLDEFNEPLTGANIIIESIRRQAVAGLDGSFQINNLAAGTYHVVVSFVGYERYEQTVVLQESESKVLHITLKPDARQLHEVVITAEGEKGSEAQARYIERHSPQVVNAISAKFIELSPDVTVANVSQRVSGLSIQRNATGDPQYAVVRGMDKRYNYTLVNGVKIPSPDNKNRYIPLDIFPANLLERLEVYKSLLPAQEGDAIGGGINMVMKDAPSRREIRGDVQLGYNQINIQHAFQRFDASVVQHRSPRDLYGDAYQAQASDFTKKNVETSSVTPLPDLFANVSYGQRFLQQKLGVLTGLSLQNAYRGTKSFWYDVETDRFGSNLPALKELQDRYYSSRQLRYATHTRLDYRFSNQHKINLYAGYYGLRTDQVRDMVITNVDGRNYDANSGNAILSYRTRTRLTDQSIITTTLHGDHQVTPALFVNWTGVWSRAASAQPDNAEFVRNGERKNFVEQPQNVERRNTRLWESNTDRDLTGYLNMVLQPEAWRNWLELKAGAMYRDKDRVNHFNQYTFDPNPALQVQGRDWNTFSDVKWSVINPGGSPTQELNYSARENISAAYIQPRLTLQAWEITGGVRVEHTIQGYTLTSPKVNQTPDSAQSYTDALPSLSVKYGLRDDMNLRATYYKAISRPGYFEVVPYDQPQEEYNEVGNPKLRRVKAHNVDVRWEYFPSTTDQLLVGVFYKTIQDPIEYAIVENDASKRRVYSPGNYGTARNWGVEFDFTRFFNKFGVKANYTFTNSTIASNKVLRTRENPADETSQLVARSVEQRRPMQGQSRHIGNLSLLYKDGKHGTNAQLAFTYTGERLETISAYLDNDMWMKPILQLDLSFEKKLGQHLEWFVKVNNLLNSPYQVYIRKPILETGDYPHQQDPTQETLIRKDQYSLSYRLGIRFNY